MINTIIFDLGAVLIDWNPGYLYRKIFKDEAQMNHFLQHICTPTSMYAAYNGILANKEIYLVQDIGH